MERKSPEEQATSPDSKKNAKKFAVESLRHITKTAQKEQGIPRSRQIYRNLFLFYMSTVCPF